MGGGDVRLGGYQRLLLEENDMELPRREYEPYPDAPSLYTDGLFATGDEGLR